MINDNNFFATNGYAYSGINNNNNMKISEDSYEVYVNKDLVGNKVLLGQNEDINDLNKFLNSNDFTNFTTSLQGNQFNIMTNNKKESKRMKEFLNSYLNIR